MAESRFFAEPRRRGPDVALGTGERLAMLCVIAIGKPVTASRCGRVLDKEVDQLPARLAGTSPESPSREGGEGPPMGARAALQRGGTDTSYVSSSPLG